MLDLSSLDQTIWLAEPVQLRQAVQRVARIPTCPTAREVVQARRDRLEEARQAAARAIRSTKGKVGVIPVHGPIEQRLSAVSMKLGGTSTEEVGAALDALVADSTVEAIVLHIDSPGGSVYGVEELGEKLHQARQRKKLYAVADSMACSAAFWLASAAEVVCCTPGGDVGSVGVYCLHVDQSRALEEEGLQVTLVRAGKHKAEANPYQPLAEDARAHLQLQVDYTYDKFLAALKRNRGVSLEHVRAQFGQGRVLNAEQALAAKMIDRIMTFEHLLRKLAGDAGSDRRASAEILRLRHQHAQRLRG